MPFAILRPHLLSVKNRVFPPGKSEPQLKSGILFAVVASIIMICIYIGMALVITSSLDNPFFRSIVPTKIIELLFYVFFFLLLVSNTISSVGNLYSSENMSLLLSSPVTFPRLYFAKLIETLSETGTMFIIFLFPAALAYVRTLNLDSSFLILGFAVSVPFLIIPAGLSVALASIFVRFAALIWRRGSFFVICVIGALAWAVNNMLQMLEHVRLERGGTNAIVQMVGLFDNPNPAWLPSRWASDILSSAVLGGKDPDYALHAGLLIAAAIGSLGLGYLAFDLLLLRVRSSATTHHRLGKNRRNASGDLIRKFLEIVYLPLPVDTQRRAIIIKDLSSLVRDRSQALQMLLYLGISTIYVIIFRFMGGAMNLSPVALDSWFAFLSSTNILFAGFILTALMTRLVYPSVSLEGRAFWILQVTPIGVEKLISAKFWCWLPLTILLTQLLLLTGAIALGASAATVLSTAIIGIGYSIGCTGLAVGIGARFASFTWESPNQISAGFGTLVLLLVSLCHVLILFVPSSVLTFLISVPALRTRLGHPQSLVLMCLAMFLILLINVVVARAACRSGIAALDKRASQ